MKKQNSVYIALVIILTASLACNLGGTAPTATPESESSSTAPTTIKDNMVTFFSALYPVLATYSSARV